MTTTRTITSETSHSRGCWGWHRWDCCCWDSCRDSTGRKTLWPLWSWCYLSQKYLRKSASGFVAHLRNTTAIREEKTLSPCILHKLSYPLHDSKKAAIKLLFAQMWENHSTYNDTRDFALPTLVEMVPLRRLCWRFLVCGHGRSIVLCIRNFSAWFCRKT